MISTLNTVKITSPLDNASISSEEQIISYKYSIDTDTATKAVLENDIANVFKTGISKISTELELKRPNMKTISDDTTYIADTFDMVYNDDFNSGTIDIRLTKTPEGYISNDSLSDVISVISGGIGTGGNGLSSIKLSDGIERALNTYCYNFVVLKNDEYYESKSFDTNNRPSGFNEMASYINSLHCGDVVIISTRYEPEYDTVSVPYETTMSNRLKADPNKFKNIKFGYSYVLIARVDYACIYERLGTSSLVINVTKDLCNFVEHASFPITPPSTLIGTYFECESSGLEPNGYALEARLSFDGGTTWDDWGNVDRMGYIPDIPLGTYLPDLRVQFKQVFWGKATLHYAKIIFQERYIDTIYESEWINFAFLTNKINSRMSWDYINNGQIIYVEAKTSPDGTDLNSSEWFDVWNDTPLASIDNYIKYRLRVVLVDDMLTPTLSDIKLEVYEDDYTFQTVSHRGARFLRIVVGSTISNVVKLNVLSGSKKRALYNHSNVEILRAVKKRIVYNYSNVSPNVTVKKRAVYNYNEVIARNIATQQLVVFNGFLVDKMRFNSGEISKLVFNGV